MKIVYKKPLAEKINEEIYKARMNNREIEKIILTTDEWENFYKELQPLCFYTDPFCPTPPHSRGGQVAIFKGIPIFVE